MKCPYCGVDQDRVIDSRPADDFTAIRRRRVCEACNKRFTTYERVEQLPLVVVKKDNTRETFSRGKIEAGILRACYKRPIPLERIKEAVDAVENECYNREDKEIDASIIGELVMEQLKELDEVAYVRFASVYREFKDANTFMDELKKIVK